MNDIDRLLDSLEARGRWARRLLMAVIAICTSGAMLALLALAGPGGFQVKQLIAALSGLFAIGYLLLWLVTASLVGAWIWRAHSNLRALGLDGLNYSPGWALGSFFVPFINFIVPFQAMRELYNRSIGEEALFAAQSASDVSAWWTAYLVGGIIPSVMLFLKSIGPNTGVHVVTPVSADQLMLLFTLVLISTAAFFLQRIIATVTSAQSAVTGVGDTFA